MSYYNYVRKYALTFHANWVELATRAGALGVRDQAFADPMTQRFFRRENVQFTDGGDMSLITMIELDDSKTLCGLLATKTLECLNRVPHPTPAETELVMLTNIFRILQMYRYDTFSDYSPQGILDAIESDTRLPVAGVPKPWFVDVKQALDAALQSVNAANKPKERVIEDVQGVLTEIAEGNQPDPLLAGQAKQFFQEFSERLTV